MKKLVYLFALLLIPALAVSQKSGKELGSAKEGYTEVEWTYLINQMKTVKKEVIACKTDEKKCKKLNVFAKGISSQSHKEQIKTILSSGFGSNFMSEMAALEKAMLKHKEGEHGPKGIRAAIKKMPGFTLAAVKGRLKFYVNRMESLDDDE